MKRKYYYLSFCNQCGTVAYRTKREAVDASCRHCDHVAQAGGVGLAGGIVAPAEHAAIVS